MGRPARGNSRVINTPTFMDAKNLQPFINQELKEMINKVDMILSFKKKEKRYILLYRFRIRLLNTAITKQGVT